MSNHEPINIIKKSSNFLSRRRFIQLGLAALGSAWAGLLLQFRLFPKTRSEIPVNPVTFPLSELPVGGSKEIFYGSTPITVIRTEESIKAFSMICTHLSCTVGWQANTNEFYCPCHDGYYDQFGEVIAGPPPVPLEQLPVRVDNKIVIIGEEV